MAFAIGADGVNLRLAANGADTAEGQTVLALGPGAEMVCAIHAQGMGLGFAADGAGAGGGQAVSAQVPGAHVAKAIGVDDVAMDRAADQTRPFIAQTVFTGGPLAAGFLGAIGAGGMMLQIAADHAGAFIAQAIGRRHPGTVLRTMGAGIVVLLGIAYATAADSILSVGIHGPLAKVRFRARLADGVLQQTVAHTAYPLVSGAGAVQRPLAAGGIIAIHIDLVADDLTADGAVRVIGQILQGLGPMIRGIRRTIHAHAMGLHSITVDAFPDHGGAVLVFMPYSEFVLAQRRIDVDVAGPEQPTGLRNQHQIQHIGEQIIFGIGIKPAHMFAVLLDHGVQGLIDRVQSLGRLHNGQIGIHAFGVVPLIDGIAVLVVDVPGHLPCCQHLLEGNAKNLALQVDQDHRAVLGIHVVVAVLTQHHGMHAHIVQILDLCIRRQMRQIGIGGNIRRHRHGILRAIRHTEHGNDRIGHIIGCVDTHNIGLAQFGDLQSQHIIHHAYRKRCGLCQCLPVFYLRAFLVDIDLISTGAGRCEQEVGHVHRLHLYKGIAQRQIVRIECGTGGRGRLHRGRLAADTGRHHDGGFRHLGGQLQTHLLIAHITVLEHQFHGIIALHQMRGRHALGNDQGMDCAVGSIQADDHIAVGIAEAVENGDGVRNLGKTLVVLQNDGNIRPYAEGIAVLLGGVTLGGYDSSLMAAGRQLEHGIAVFVSTHKAAANGNHHVGNRQAVVVLHMNGIGDYLFLKQPDNDLLGGIIGRQQVLGGLCGKTVGKNQLDHIAALRQHGADQSFFIGSQNHRLAVNRESGGDACHGQAFHVLKRQAVKDFL